MAMMVKPAALELRGVDSTGGQMAQARKDGAANVGFEAELWKAADALRGSMDAAEYKHVVLGLLFLKYISDGRVPPCGVSSASA